MSIVSRLCWNRGGAQMLGTRAVQVPLKSVDFLHVSLLVARIACRKACSLAFMKLNIGAGPAFLSAVTKSFRGGLVETGEVYFG